MLRRYSCGYVVTTFEVAAGSDHIYERPFTFLMAIFAQNGAGEASCAHNLISGRRPDTC